MTDNTELIDIVDVNDTVIGTALRTDVHQQNLNHRASHIIINYNNYVYLQLRAANKKQFPNKWDISAAGHVKSGCNYDDTALCELKEELNITVTNKQIVKLGKIKASEHTGYEFITVYTYKCTTLPKIILESIAITTGGWFEIEHVTNWLQNQPQDFAGCFNLIWEMFLINLSNNFVDNLIKR